VTPLTSGAQAEHVEVLTLDLVDPPEQIVRVVENVEEPAAERIEPAARDVDNQSAGQLGAQRVVALAEPSEDDACSTSRVRTNPGVMANTRTPRPASSTVSESVRRRRAAFADAYPVT